MAYLSKICCALLLAVGMPPLVRPVFTNNLFSVAASESLDVLDITLDLNYFIPTLVSLWVIVAGGSISFRVKTG